MVFCKPYKSIQLGIFPYDLLIERYWGNEGGNKEFKVRTSKSHWVSKNVLLFAKSPRFDYESYHKIFSSLQSTIQIYFMMVNYMLYLRNGHEIMHQKPHSKQHSLSNIANLAFNNRLH